MSQKIIQTSSQARLIVIGVALLLTLGMGIRQSFGLFLTPVTQDLALTAADFTLTLAIQNIVWGLSQAFVGAAADRFGLRITMMVGAAIYVLGLGIMAVAQGIFALIVSGGLIGVALSCTATSLGMTACVRAASEARRSTTLGLVAAVMGASTAAAHEGPPFPILMDQRTQDYVVSVWADPDIGEAVFYVVVESPEGGSPVSPPKAVSLWAEPTSGRLQRMTYEATPQTLRNQLQFEARPHFDQRDMWTVGVCLVGPGGRREELTTEIESTPPGYGPWDLAIYLFPFLLLGGLWAAAMIRRYRAQWRLRESGGAVDGSD